MTLRNYYYSLGTPKFNKQASLVRPLIGATMAGGVAGSLYGMGSKDNATRDPLHPSTSTYGMVGLQGGLGLGAGMVANKLLGVRGGLLGRGIPVLGAGLGTMLGLERASKNGRPDLRLKQPGVDYGISPEEYKLQYLAQEASKL